MAELTYTRVGGYYIPDLALDPESAEPVRIVGKYGSLRRSYLKQHKHDLWRELAGSGKLTSHLLDVDGQSAPSDDGGRWRDQGIESP